MASFGSLHATGTKDAGRLVQLTGTEFTIGRKEACDLRYTGDNLISSVHAKLFVRSGEVWLEDCSANGTYHKSRRSKGASEPFIITEEDCVWWARGKVWNCEDPTRCHLANVADVPRGVLNARALKEMVGEDRS